MSLRTTLGMALTAAAITLGGPASADPPAANGDGDTPVGLERLKKSPGPSGPLPGSSGESETDGKETPPPKGAKGLGQGPDTGAGHYSPGAPTSSGGSRTDSIGGGTRVNDRAGSALDDIK